MVQGCTSDAGKSVIVAGLCRVLARDGKRVAPFKPQNMALNSAVTADGGEIGRAQAVQAQACNVPAHTDFNPILLKPNTDIGAQVIVHGHAVGNMQAQSYHQYKQVALQAVLDSHRRLTTQYAHIVVEGAGSPAEINLRDRDIANMGFAEAVDCPVILVADIDRGGVFAHLVGTLSLLSATEQARVVGFVINRFRGDIALLQSGLDWLEQQTGKPVLGVVPYLHDFYLDAEDAICAQQPDAGATSKLNIVVPVLPRISNHTDFDALRLHPDVQCQFVSIHEPCPPTDLIIFPGSKNVISDLRALKQAGWQETLERHLRYGGRVLGICGGYQMLGQSVQDPLGIENSEPGETETGFGLLACETVLQPHKQLRQCQGQIQLGSLRAAITGYEIHCGTTTSDERTPVHLKDGRGDGSVSADNAVLGSYLHGLFDHAEAAHALLTWAGLRSENHLDLNAIREHQLDRLADCLIESLSPELWLALGVDINRHIPAQTTSRQARS
ncbi:cobyric acid synthase [Arenicella chitinivorans]|uniref:Cobyric acid synthase n=1 Tax=Arenicella chitinivorans TaxID=1329800 RepID=A0A918VHU3_9GAMM|nr:cobyric acid synthase [Arenicella chitinivorans]GHA02468.1 cobyric acid synthase [Arenicella chitinivorans]